MSAYEQLCDLAESLRKHHESSFDMASGKFTGQLYRDEITQKIMERQCSREQLGLLVDAATPTLKQDFEKSVNHDGSVNNENLAISLCHAFQDALIKETTILLMMMGAVFNDGVPVSVEFLAFEKKESIYQNTHSLKCLLADIVHNYLIVAPVSTGEDSVYSNLLKLYEGTYIPDLEKILDELSSEWQMTFDDTKDYAQGTEHLKRLPPSF